VEAVRALDLLPALAYSRERLLAALAREPEPGPGVAAALEDDPGLLGAALRAANAEPGRRGRVISAPGAAAALGRAGLLELASSVPCYGFFAPIGAWGTAPRRMRLHALATRQIALQLAASMRHPDPARLAAASLLHDLGKLVLARGYPDYSAAAGRNGATPEERVASERRVLIVDHAAMGGVLARRWGLPEALAAAIESHHAPGAGGDAAIVRLADMLVHYRGGDPVSEPELTRAAGATGVRGAVVESLLAGSTREPALQPRAVVPCPLTRREREVLERLAAGAVYKQIAADLSVSVSSVRTHLHNVYAKLGVIDRAQAVLAAARQGWIELEPDRAPACGFPYPG
jgi:putative nucleotidyltransferase with HDIG domain